MGEMNTEMKEIFDKYNKAGNVPAGGFSKEQLKTNEKAKAILEVIRLAEKNLRKNAAKVFEQFNVSFKYTSSDNSKLGDDIVNAIDFNFTNNGDKKDLDVAVNFNFSKLGQLPAEEAYSIVYATMHSSLLKKREALSLGNDFQFGKEDEVQEKVVVNDANFDRQGNYVEPKHPILDYIKKFLLKVFFGIESGKKESDYSACAKQIEQDFNQGGIYAEDMFENSQGNNLLAERYGKIVKQGYEQQATYLLGEISKEEFNSLKSGNDQEIMNFCGNYARTILKMSGLDERIVPITFEPKGEIGSYTDYGNRQEVNININKVKEMKNPAEVVMTIQHELTHAIDSSIHKSDVKKKLGDEAPDKIYGLTDNLVGDTSQGIESVKDEAPEVYNYVVKLQEICYRINPNERSARIGELTAIKFMKGMHPDKDMQKYIDKSIDSYNSYQNKVIANIAECETVAQKYETVNGKSVVKDGGRSILVVKDSTKKIIEKRLGYIESLKQRGMLDPTQEKEAIAIALGEKLNTNNQNLSQEGVEMTTGE